MTVARLLFSFQGRIPRRDYWLKGFMILLPLWLFFNVVMLFRVGGHGVLALVIGIVSLWPALALLIKRLHDRNRSGWFAATLLIPIANIVVGIWILVEVWFLRGTIGTNRFGEDPVHEEIDAAIASAHPSSLTFVRKRPTGVSVVGSALIVLSMIRLFIICIPQLNDKGHIGYVSASLMPADFIVAAQTNWMWYVFSWPPFGAFGVMGFEFVSVLFAYYTGLGMLYGVGLARWLYLGWGAFGILINVTSRALPPGYVVVHLLIYASFTVVLLRKNSSGFFSKSNCVTLRQ